MSLTGLLLASDPVGLITAIRAGKTSDEWFEETGWPLLDASTAQWKSRNVIPSALYELLEPVLKSQSWSLAHQWDTQFLNEILDSLSDSIINQKSVKDWLPIAEQILVKYGAGSNAPRLYAGLEKFKPFYADMVFRTNDAVFHAAGRYAEMFSREWIALSPYWLYLAIHDGRTRPAHAALDGKVFRKDDAAARYLLPPSGYNCRCVSIEVSEDDLEAGGYKVSKGADMPAELWPTTDWAGDRVASLVPDAMRGSLRPPDTGGVN